MIQKIKANCIFSADLKSPWKSLWLGPLLIVWHLEWLDRWYPVGIEYAYGWYGWDYWQPQEVEWEVQSESD